MRFILHGVVLGFGAIFMMTTMCCSQTDSSGSHPRLRFEKGQKVVFDGDSGTHRRTGAGHSEWPYLQLMGWDVNWADEFAKLAFCWAPELSLDFKNVAVGGSKSYDILERVKTSVLPHKPDWVLATIGGNDAAVQLPLDEFETNLKAYAKKIHDTSGGQVVFLNHSYLGPDVDKWAPYKKAGNEKRKQYLKRLEKIARDVESIHFLDLTDGFAKRADAIYGQHPLHTVYSDGGHLNHVGSLIFAGEVMHAFNLSP